MYKSRTMYIISKKIADITFYIHWKGSDPEIDYKHNKYPNMGEHDAWLSSLIKHSEKTTMCNGMQYPPSTIDGIIPLSSRQYNSE